LEVKISGGEKKNGKTTTEIEENHFLPLDSHPSAPLKISIVMNIQNYKNMERSFRSISDSLEPTGVVRRKNTLIEGISCIWTQFC
jgi:hypothetical protein